MNRRTLVLFGCLAIAALSGGCGSDANPGEVQGSRISTAAAQGGCTVVCPPCDPSSPVCPKAPCRLVCPPGVTPCGDNVCRKGELCCDASCGVCSAPDGTCAVQPCPQPTVCVQTALCIRGFHWSPEQCQCVPDNPGACAADDDCRLFSDYCTGCDCRALANSDPDPLCDGPGVRCFADPCQNQTARCSAGYCVTATQCVDTQLCVRGSHWSPELCSCVPDRGPRQPHSPRVPHSPHSPRRPRS
ncbi:MAG: hypothetical protein HY270_12530 [Deltaproteobacteria bacterium]|nr:hypothetical protein [Deltaproteobacteria bacterium]